MEQPKPGGFDLSIIRPGMHAEEFGFRGQEMTAKRLREIKKALHSLHTLEIMAANLYRFQISRDPSDLNLQLIIAMCNEMTHIQDFQVKLYEYGLRPSKRRWAFWIAGLVIGFGSRLLAPRSILKTAAWVERKAVRHYGELLEGIEWDEDLRRIIEKDRSDEEGHISRWQGLLESS
jgi:demethoxyubiquinone hydroxylase (CLK1/Coq7/Cat5 family)